MANVIGDYVLDNGLSVFNGAALGIYICSQDPTTYTEATSTYALGAKTGAAGSRWGAPAAGSPNGRKVSSVAITDGAVTATGLATKWATVDGSHLLANGSLSGAGQILTAGDSFTLATFSVRLQGVAP